ncbi:alpha-L-rhamnosidase C-terminal domain-containing protein [Streptomyces sp. NPDC047917]|uniref:alpha-L-rhamnosidase C-terminal domain-containing protein n=1 Tax=Streptomyces sp. NPDC047917 TaxID=3365491 RepID=UPI003723476A
MAQHRRRDAQGRHRHRLLRPQRRSRRTDRRGAGRGSGTVPCAVRQVRDAFRTAYVSAGGRVKGDTRTSNEAPARFDSPYGPVSTGWSTASGTFRLEVSLPVDTIAEVWMAASAASEVAHGPARFPRLEDRCAVFAVGSGTHRFSR